MVIAAVSDMAVLLALLGPALSGGQAQAATAGTAAASPAAASPAAASATASSDRLLPGEALQPGQSITGGHDTLTMRGNGTSSWSPRATPPIWSRHTSGNQGAQLVMQPNGNLAVLAPGGQPADPDPLG
jgi:hypothetical protein